MVAGNLSLGDAAPLFGRGEAAEQIQRLLRDRLSGSGGVWLLIGEGGVGKSTLLRAAREAARSLDYQVLEGRALPSDVPPPYGLLEDVLKSVRRELQERAAQPSISGEVMPLFLAPYERGRTPEVPLGAPDSHQVSDSVEADHLLARLENPTERVDATRATLVSQLTDFFLAMARNRPLLLALDDLHFADESSLEVLLRLAQLAGDAPLVVLGTTLPLVDVPARSAPSLDLLQNLALVGKIPVRRMTEPEVAQFVKWILNGREPARDAVMRWFTQTEGNPLFVEHLVRASLGFGVVAPDADREGKDLGELLKSRIRSFSEPDRRVLVYAAVLGKEFDFPSLGIASGQEEERISESLDRLVQGGILREQGGEVYEFISERVRADVYADLTETRRRILHRKAARALEARPGGPAQVFELARQFYLGRDDAKALEYNRRAADLSAQAFATDTAVVYLDRALEAARRLVPRDVTVELRLQIELGRLLDELGDFKRSEETLLDAVAGSRSEVGHETELAIALLGLAQTRSDLTQYAASRELAQEAFQILERVGNRRGLIVAHRVLGTDSWRLGNLTEAEAHQRSALALAEEDQVPSAIGHALVDLANTLTQFGHSRTNDAMDLYGRAAEIFAQGHDHGARARVLMNRSLLHHNEGRLDDAVRELERAIESAERSPSRIWVGYCQLNMAQFRAEQHDVPAAKSALAKAVALLEPLGDQLALQQTTMIRGMVAEEEHDPARAEESYIEALRRAKELALGPEVSEMNLRLAELAERRGDHPRARRWLQGAREAGILSLRGDLAPQVIALEQRLQKSAS